ncbi:NAD(P)H-hydrate dehydratase [Niabella yanshanensis]|uniref:Bifunctional NAD(P)H-hydrate repair enzyme n=1 Tax=Niabella yanshanensis TaxID=577386 RepID=A0ABZ0WCI0_9BACT|nr:NAD(P)H-hydrate dehydratase [Niabella yanshanensis]WQD39542.1 NAD(P)H-hydrate dehydratase [Niabella yanshanensis]
MKLLNASQIREWDQYTIQDEPISSIDLMERAARACRDWIRRQFPTHSFDIFCCTGNNGGDGLAIARLLMLMRIPVKVFIVNAAGKASRDFTTNLERLKAIPGANIIELTSGTFPPPPDPSAIIIDALLGTGINRPIEGFTGEIVSFINAQSNKVIAIDMPSGLQSDTYSGTTPIIQANHTLTFQIFKLGLLMPCNAGHFGQVHVLDIGLAPAYLTTVESKYELTEKTLFASFYKTRENYAHKGNFGHALIIAGSYGKMGAAVLSTKACLRSGAGLVTAHVPGKGVNIIQTSAPEAMCQTDPDGEMITTIQYPLKSYSAIGIGPGTGTHPSTQKLLQHIFNSYSQPLVLDADALNILSENKPWLNLLPENSIITPHPKEFSRLFGEQSNDFERIETALEQASHLKIIIILKGHRTFIATPAGKGYFNTTGNAGMATGGSGDVLTGLITGLLAQGYTAAEAAIMGVYLHGLAGDKAAAVYGMEAMIAGDLVKKLRFPAFE